MKKLTVSYAVALTAWLDFESHHGGPQWTEQRAFTLAFGLAA